MKKVRGLMIQSGGYLFRRRRPRDIPGGTYWTRYIGSINNTAPETAQRIAMRMWQSTEDFISVYRATFDPDARAQLIEAGDVELFRLALLNKRRDLQRELALVPDAAASDDEQARAYVERIRAARELEKTQTALLHLEAHETFRQGTTQPDTPSTIAPLVDLWQRRAKPKSPGAIAKAKLWAERFADFVGDATPLEAIEPQDVRKFRDHIEASEDYSRITARHGLATLNTLFKHAVDAGAIDANPFAGVTVHVPAPTSYSAASAQKGFTVPQIKTLLDALGTLPHDDHRWTVRLMIYHGLRAGECAILRSDDIAAVDGVMCIHVRDTHGRRIKTKASARIVPLHKACKAFEGYAARRDDYIFEGNDNQISRAKRLQDVLNPWIKEQLGAGTLHGLRHTFRTMCRDVSMPLEVSAAIMGHALPGEHFAYGRRPDVTVLARWINRIDPLA